MTRCISSPPCRGRRATLRIFTSARAWCDIFTPNPAIEELIVREKDRGTRLVLASNTNELHYQWFSRVFARVLKLFDEQVLSFRVGARKPDVRFFEECSALGNPTSGDAQKHPSFAASLEQHGVSTARPEAFAEGDFDHREPIRASNERYVAA